MSQIIPLTDSPTDAYTMPRPSTSSTSGFTPEKKKILGISAAALLLGGSAWAVAQKIKDKTNGDTTSTDGTSANDTSSTTTAASLPADIDVAGKVLDTMSFDDAFKAAREEVGVGGVFSWHGRWYNTFEKEEWSDLSLEQRQEFTEMVTQEELPVKPYHLAVAATQPVNSEPSLQATIIEGHINGQRVMGLDFDHDGTIDTLVMEGNDGYTYRVVDQTGDDGLDTILRYDSLDGELMAVSKLESPFVLSNDQFNQGLEESMSREIVDSILEPELAPEPTNALAINEYHNADDDKDTLGNSYDDDDDTYTNDGNVQDMDE